MTTESNSFTINLPKSDPKLSNTSNDARSIDYIIERNQNLDEENKELRRENTELAHKLEEEEEYNDSNQKKNNNLKMVLKNFVETKKVQTQISISQIEMYKLAHENTRQLTAVQTENYYLMCTIMSYNSGAFVLFSLFSSFVFLTLLLALTCFVNFGMFQKIYQNQEFLISQESIMINKIKQIKNTIKMHKESIKKMEETSDYLNEYIDLI